MLTDPFSNSRLRHYKFGLFLRLIRPGGGGLRVGMTRERNVSTLLPELRISAGPRVSTKSKARSGIAFSTITEEARIDAIRESRIALVFERT